MADKINLNDVLPSYLTPLFTFDYSQWIPVILLSLLLLIILYHYLQYLKIKTLLNEKYSFLEVIPTSNSAQTAFSTEQLFTILHSLEKPIALLGGLIQVKQTISCELISTKEEGIRYILFLPSGDVSVIKKSLLAYLPGIQIKEVTDCLPSAFKDISSNQDITIKELKLSRKYVYPLQEQSVLKEYDPISYITAHMTKLEKDDLVGLQIICTPILENTHSSESSYLYKLQKSFLSNTDITNSLETGFIYGLVSFIFGLFGLSKSKRISEIGTFKQQL